MRFHWLHRHNNPDCILFLSGWGMGPEPFQDIPAGNYDLLLVYDYTSLVNIDFHPLQGYERIHLLAWSMGVWVAGILLGEEKQRFFSSIALGGTLSPINAQRGIAPERFSSMIETFSSTSLRQFYQSMFDDAAQLERFLQHRPRRSEDALRGELMHLRKTVQEKGSGQEIFDHKIIPSRDRIFPAHNQRNAWGKGQYTAMKWPHFPFYETKNWSNLLTLCHGREPHSPSNAVTCEIIVPTKNTLS